MSDESDREDSHTKRLTKAKRLDESEEVWCLLPISLLLTFVN